MLGNSTGWARGPHKQNPHSDGEQQTQDLRVERWAPGCESSCGFCDCETVECRAMHYSNSDNREKTAKKEKKMWKKHKTNRCSSWRLYRRRSPPRWPAMNDLRRRPQPRVGERQRWPLADRSLSLSSLPPLPPHHHRPPLLISLSSPLLTAPAHIRYITWRLRHRRPFMTVSTSAMTARTTCRSTLTPTLNNSRTQMPTPTMSRTSRPSRPLPIT